MAGKRIRTTHPRFVAALIVMLSAAVVLAACRKSSDVQTTEPTPVEATTEAAPALPAVPACDLLTTGEVASVMGYPGATTFDEDDVCKFVAVRDSRVVFGNNVNVLSGVLGQTSLREFAETFGAEVGVSGENGQPLKVEFGEEVTGLGDEALAATTEIRALAVRVGNRAFVIGVTLAGKDFAAEVRKLADAAVTRL